VSLDESTVLWLAAEVGSPALDPLFVWLSDRWTFSFPLLALLLADALRRAGTRGLALWLLLVLAVAVGDQTGNALKRVVAEPRPCAELAEQLRGPEAGARRPCSAAGNGAVSNHALNFAVAAAFVARTTPWVGWHRLLAATTLLVATSRVYLARHYPSQVLAGLVVGAGLGLLAGAVACRLGLGLRAPPGRRVETPPRAAPSPLPLRHVLGLGLLLTALPLLRAGLQQVAGLELHFDEAQYWEWSRRLDWGYYSKGPLVAWLIAGSTALFGVGEWQVRLPAWLAFDAFMLLLFLAAREVAGSVRAAWWAVLLALATPLLLLLGGVMTTDVLLLPLWTLGLWGAWRLAERGDTTGWYWLGAAVGLGALTKLSILLLPLLALPMLAFSPAARATLRTAHPWAAGLLALALAAPVIAWNAAHGWVLLRHDQGHVLGPGETQGNLVELLAGQFAAALPLFVGALAAGLWRPPAGGGARVLWGVSLATLGLNGLKAVWSKVQLNWPAPAYPGLLVLVAARIPGLTGARRAWVWAAVGLGLAAGGIAHFPQAVGLGGARDPFSELKAWRAPVAELAARAGPVDFLLTARYTLATELAFYWPGHPPVYLTGDPRRRMNQYDLWPGVNREVGRTGLFVSTRADRPEVLDRAFDACEALEPLPARSRDGAVVRTLHAWRCTGYRPVEWPAPGRY
jgi:undecaprenyl-diphosphatase